MLVNSISLGNYRNYRSMQINFHPNLNIFVGDNAQGKTNILEAVYYAATGKSHRTNYDNDLITHGEQGFHIVLDGERLSGRVKIEISVRSDGKKLLKVNNQPKKKLSELMGTLNAVFFSPEDILLVKGGPSVRRRFLDMEISQTSPFYCHNLANYNRVLAQRNNLLKAIREQMADCGLLDVWDEQMAEYGIRIIKKRAEVIEKIKPLAGNVHHRITGGREELSLKYVPSIDILPAGDVGPTEEQLFLRKLKDKRKAETAKGLTITGPHRDDMDIRIGDTNIRSFGSQGQQRTCALSLKLSEVEFIRAETGENPVLLLDDVMSELDAGRRRFLLEAVDGKMQTFVTCTDMEDVFWPVRGRSRIFEVREGNIILLQEG